MKPLVSGITWTKGETTLSLKKCFFIWQNKLFDLLFAPKTVLWKKTCPAAIVLPYPSAIGLLIVISSLLTIMNQTVSVCLSGVATATTESIATNSFTAVPVLSRSGVYSFTKLDLDETLFRCCTIKSYPLYNEEEPNSFLHSLHIHKSGEALITDVPGEMKITWTVEESVKVSCTLNFEVFHTL